MESVQHAEDGYTLLELLIGMVLVALIMATLVMGIHVGIRAWESGQARLRETALEQAQNQFLARQIASLVPYQIVSRDPDRPVQLIVLEAAASRFRFLSTYGSRAQNRSGLALTEYVVLDTSPRKVGVFLRETPVKDDATLLDQLVQGITDDPESGKKIITFRPFVKSDKDFELMKDLTMACFEYLAPGTLDKAPSWVSDFTATPAAPYPQAIRLRWQQGGVVEVETVPVRAQLALPG